MWVYVYMNILYVLFFDWPFNLMILYLGKLKYLLFPMKWWDRMPWSSFSEYWAWLWPPHAKSWLIGKDFDAGRDWGKEKKGTTEDEMAGWHHWLDGGESEWTPGVGDGQGGLACRDSWGCKESDTTEQLNWTELNWTEVSFICCVCLEFNNE